MAFTCNIFLNSQLGAACKINSNAIAMTDKLCRKIVSKLSCMNDSTVKNAGECSGKCLILKSQRLFRENIPIITVY